MKVAGACRPSIAIYGKYRLLVNKWFEKYNNLKW